MDNTQTKHYYFGYGMNSDPQQMIMRTGQPVAIGRGLVRDHAFRFALHADVYPQEGTNVHGVLWEIDDAALKSLDCREGYPYYYERKIVQVECGGQMYDAIMYYMTPGHQERQPSQGYYDMLVRGYTAFNISLEQIESALQRSVIAPESMTDLDTYKFNRAVIAYQSHGYSGFTTRKIRWFNSYTELVKFTHGRKMLKRVQAEADVCCISLEQMCSDYINYEELFVPEHFRVRESSEWRDVVI
jgi:gamma-glutamylcyclotransferase (GGCT)/AIG2-like uncharacterized protein YtfP